MTDLTITDLFNIDITNSYIPYILVITIYDMPKYLFKTSEYKNLIFYDYNSDTLGEALIKKNIDINDYNLFGTITGTLTNNVIKILMGHKYNINSTNKYTNIISSNNLYIWKPDETNNYTNLGLLITTTQYAPNTFTSLLQMNDVKINKSCVDDSVNIIMNEYNLINNCESRYIITTNLLDMNYSFGENFGNGINDIDEYARYYSDTQNKKTVKIDNGDNNIKQKKYKQYPWEDCRIGKHVVLVEDNNPWYINKTCTIPAKIILDDSVSSTVNKAIRRSDVLSKNNMALFDSTAVLDTTKPNLNLGYSYASRNRMLNKQSSNNLIETFDNLDVNNSNKYHEQLTLTVLVIIILIIIICNRNK